MTDVSIVIPVYNGERFLSQAIESVLQQSSPDWELIVVDDGSTDGTYRIAEAYARQDPRIRVIQQPNSGSCGAARNRGMRECSSESTYVAFLDADDFWYPRALASLLQAMAGSEQAVATYGLPRLVDTASGPVIPDRTTEWEEAYGRKRSAVSKRRFVELPGDAPTTFSALVCWNWILSPGQVLIRRAALDAVGNFDPETFPSEDWDLWIRLSLLGDIVLLPEFTLNRRIHGENISGNFRLMSRAEAAVRCKLAYSPQLSPEQGRTAKWGLVYWYLHRLSWATSAWRSGHYWQAADQFAHAVVAYVRVRRALFARRGAHCLPLVAGTARVQEPVSLGTIGTID